MAIHDNPRIVTNGLILCLDAANPKSYPGSGTTWYDISGNDNHFTLQNSPTFTNNAFSFDGVNDYAISSNVINLSSYDSVTWEIVVKTEPETTGPVYAFERAFISTGDIEFLTNSDVFSGFQENYAFTVHGTLQKLYLSNLNLNTWGFHSHVYSRIVDSTGRLAYQDGGLKSFFDEGSANSSTATTTTSFNDKKITLGANYNNNVVFNPFQGLISSFRIYNRKLTLAEHRINFNAFRGRFGI